VTATTSTSTTDLLEQFRAVRVLTERLAGLLTPEDQSAQSMPDASPTKWHRAHTTWFFEEFLLDPTGQYAPYDASYGFLAELPAAGIERLRISDLRGDYGLSLALAP